MAGLPYVSFKTRAQSLCKEACSMARFCHFKGQKGTLLGVGTSKDCLGHQHRETGVSAHGYKTAPLTSPIQVPHSVQTQIQDRLQGCDRPGLALLPWSYWGRLPRTPRRPRSHPTTPGARASDSLGATGPRSQAFSLQQRGPTSPW